MHLTPVLADLLAPRRASHKEGVGHTEGRLGLALPWVAALAPAILEMPSSPFVLTEARRPWVLGFSWGPSVFLALCRASSSWPAFSGGQPGAKAERT